MNLQMKTLLAMLLLTLAACAGSSSPPKEEVLRIYADLIKKIADRSLHHHLTVTRMEIYDLKCQEIDQNVHQCLFSSDFELESKPNRWNRTAELPEKESFQEKQVKLVLKKIDGLWTFLRLG